MIAASGSPFASGANPDAVATADFNGDGIPDLAAANFSASTITVLLGNGSGGFSAATGSPFATGTNPDSIVNGDFNGDGIQDLATANFNANTVTVLLGNGSGGFTAATGSPFAVGSQPFKIVVGDFNGDGLQDLAVANFGDNNITILLGNGSGGFAPSPASPFPAANPNSLIVGDFNQDGKQDLAAVNLGNNAVTVLLGNGAGAFKPATGSPFSVGSSPETLVTADFNGDGKPDLATANEGDGTISVLLSNGTGGFLPATSTSFGLGTGPLSMVTGDFNGDGLTDLAVSSSGGNNVTVLVGNGSGAFTAASPFTSGTGPASLVAADFNGDGVEDIATANDGSNNLTVLLGGVVSTTSVLSTNSPLTITLGQSVPLTLAVSDTNAAFNAPTGTATFKDGSTVFGTAGQTASPYTFTASSLGLGSHTQTANHSGDARTLASTSNTITIQVNQDPQTITFAPLSNISFGTPPFTIGATASSGLAVSFTSTTTGVCTVSATTVTILSGGTCTITASQAGNTNYLAAAPVSQSFSVTTQTQTISFDAIPGQLFGVSPFPITAKSSSGLAVSFLSTTTAVCNAAGALVIPVTSGTCSITASQSGNASYAAATPVVRSFSLNLANPSGTLTAAPASPFAVGTNPDAIAIGDFNGDGIPDFAVANSSDNTVTVLLGNASGGFSAPAASPFAVGTNPVSVVAGDFNGDGIQDLAAANSGGSSITVLLGNGSGGFTPASGSPFAVGNVPASVVIGDFNGDGIQDLATANPAGNSITILLGNGSGGFTVLNGFPAGTNPASLAVGDFNGDGIQDLAAANSNSNNITILLGNGSGGFTAASGSPVAAGTLPLSVIVGDFNGDGLQDLAVANSNSNNVTVLLGNGSGGFSSASASPFTVGTNPHLIVAGDFNGDGLQDLATANYGGNNVTVLLGDGSGGFTAAAGGPFTVGTNPSAIVAGDFNGDGIRTSPPLITPPIT